jgi:flavin-dependent dehydrogenase
MKVEEQTSGSYDVAILGGGPAGCATALALKRRAPNLRIVLLEKTSYSTLRIGESLPPPARALLVQLGVWEAFLSGSPMRSYGTRAAWGSPELHDNEFIFSPYGNGWHLDRRNFDAMLSQEARRAGVAVFLNARTEMRGRIQDLWRLTTCDNAGKSYEITTRLVVDATGRRSSFAATQGAERMVYDQLAGVFTFFRFSPGNSPADTYTSLEACEHGWWYTAMLPDCRMAVAFMTDAGQLRNLPWRTVEQFHALAASAPHTVKRLAGTIPLEAPRLHSASSQRLENAAGPEWLAVGDAAGTFDPLSSLGIVKALRSGIHASHAICGHLDGDADALPRYSAALAREYGGYLDGRAAYYEMEQRWPDSPFWQCRHERIMLDPREVLQCRAISQSASALPKIASRLPAHQLRLLVQICNHPRAASDAIKEFHSRSGHAYSDRNVVLALQDLVKQNILFAGPADSFKKHSQGGITHAF